MLRRQCTYDWKIAPIRRWLQAHRDKMPVEMWLGITMDESQRMKPSNVKYITHRWPFCDEMNMRRDDVRRWLVEHGLGVPPRSACVFCPYHSDREWRDLRDVVPDDWRDALTFDAAIRGLRPPYSLFVCNKRMPLVDVQLKGDREELELWENECEGICGV